MGRSRRRNAWVPLALWLLPAPWLLPAGAAKAEDTDVVINEVFYAGTAGEDWVELKNTGAAPIDVGGWWLRARFSDAPLADLALLDGDLLLDPGEIVRVGAVAGSLNGLVGTGSDLGLYTTDNFPSTAALVDFVQWGTEEDFGNGTVAADKGIWTAFAFPFSAPFDFVEAAAAGESLSYGGTNGGGALLTLSSDFENGVPTPGSENPPGGSTVFADGFESGATSSWSSSVGE